MLYIGNHTSSSRGYLAMGKQMLANGGNTFAFFTRNPRGGKSKDIDPQRRIILESWWLMRLTLRTAPQPKKTSGILPGKSCQMI